MMLAIIESDFVRAALTGLAATTAVGSVILAIALSPVGQRVGSKCSAARRHQLLQVVLVGLLLLPFLLPGLVGSTTLVEAPSHAEFSFGAAGKFPDMASASDNLVAQGLVAQGGAGAQVDSSDGIVAAVLMVWLVGIAIALLRLGARVRHMMALKRRSRAVTDPRWLDALASARAELGVRRSIRLLTHPQVRSPMIWGPPAAFVLMPSDMIQRCPEAAGGRMTFLHELGHLIRRDSVSKLVADLVCAVHWFNPLIWAARRRLDVEQEIAADSRVLQAGVLPSVYSGHLLELFRRRRQAGVALAGLSAAVGESPLARRLDSILDRASRHGTPRPRVTVLLGSVLAAGAALCSLVRGHIGDAMVAPPPSLHEVLNPLVVNSMADSYIAGAAISVVKDGVSAYEHGFGRAEVFGPKPVVADRTIFRIGSVTKMLTGIAVMQCVDRGLLDLEGDVNQYLTEFKIGEEFPQPVRVKHLLTHTAGFDQLGYGRHVQSEDQVLPKAEFLRGNLIRIRPPGQLSCYDTYAITLAGYLVEVVSGLGYEEYLRENIFEPLGMERSFITVPDHLRDDLAVGYEFAGQWSPQRWEHMNTEPASSVNSTVVDMTKLASALLAGGILDGKRILSTKSAQAMMVRQFSNHADQPGYGLSMFEDPNYGVPAFSHGGSMTGFSCMFYLVPSAGLGVFVAYNQESGRLAERIIRATVSNLVPDLVRVPTPRARVGGVDPSRFAGSYASNMYNHTRRRRGGGERGRSKSRWVATGR